MPGKKQSGVLGEGSKECIFGVRLACTYPGLGGGGVLQTVFV
jgi:hypothetical protein